MLALETKQSGDKLLPHSDLRKGGGVFPGEASRSRQRGMKRMSEERGVCKGSWWGSRRETDHWGDLGVDGWIILGWISRR